MRYRETFGNIHYFTKELALQMINDLGYQVFDYFYSGRPTEAIPLPQNEIIRILGNSRLLILAK